jgi:trehalose-6-phosphate synthase
VTIHKEQAVLEEDGKVSLSPQVMDSAGLQAGDTLIVSLVAPGVIQLRKAQLLDRLSSEEIRRRLREALIKSGYDTKEKVLQMVREIKREMAREW